MKCKTCKGRGKIEREYKPRKHEAAKLIKEVCYVCEGSGRINTRKRGGKDKGFDWSIDD